MSKLFWSGLLFGLVLVGYAIFSYSLTDPNLILTSWSPYWNFQLKMWQTFFHNRQLLTYTYTGLVLVLFGLYLGILGFTQKKLLHIRHTTYYILYLLPLFLSYNALSHDVFNYIFNAKIVLYFQANPHIKVALDYFYDDWTRFMHNTHTPAPYGYGWTALSLIPYSLGMMKFLPTWLLFRLFSIVSLGFLGLSLKFTAQSFQKKLFLTDWLILFANPLVLVELVSNSHNDAWMMAPAITSLGLIGKKPNVFKVVLSGILLGASVSIKLATLVLIPVWLFLVLKSHWQKVLPKVSVVVNKNIHLVSSMLMFVPLFTLRSQQFLPWYLVWPMSFLPLVKNKLWRAVLIAFSITSMLRYVPWLWAGGFEGDVVLHQKMISWSAFILIGIYFLTHKTRIAQR